MYFIQVHLVEWLKIMVGARRAEEVVDPDMELKPAIRALKRALLVALRCVDPDSEKRPTMGQVVRMLETEDVPSREVVQLVCFPHDMAWLYISLCNKSELSVCLSSEGPEEQEGP
jgi:hypothetical protein